LDLQTSHVIIFAVWVGLCLAGVFSGLVVRPPPPRVSAITTTLAMATYPLYLLHQELGNRAILELTEFGFPISLSLVTGVALCVAPSIFTSLKIEPPLRKKILR